MDGALMGCWVAWSVNSGTWHYIFPASLGPTSATSFLATRVLQAWYYMVGITWLVVVRSVANESLFIIWQSWYPDLYVSWQEANVITYILRTIFLVLLAPLVTRHVHPWVAGSIMLQDIYTKIWHLKYIICELLKLYQFAISNSYLANFHQILAL